jgi:hypothetical protein
MTKGKGQVKAAKLGLRIWCTEWEPAKGNCTVVDILTTVFNCCFTVHFDKYKIILPTNALFIKNIKCYNVYLTPTCFDPSWTIIREYTFVPR